MKLASVLVKLLVLGLSVQSRLLVGENTSNKGNDQVDRSIVRPKPQTNGGNNELMEKLNKRLHKNGEDPQEVRINMLSGQGGQNGKKKDQHPHVNKLHRGNGDGNGQIIVVKKDENSPKSSHVKPHRGNGDGNPQIIVVKKDENSPQSPHVNKLHRGNGDANPQIIVVKDDKNGPKSPDVMKDGDNVVDMQQVMILTQQRPVDTLKKNGPFNVTFYPNVNDLPTYKDVKTARPVYIFIEEKEAWIKKQLRAIQMWQGFGDNWHILKKIKKFLAKVFHFILYLGRLQAEIEQLMQDRQFQSQQYLKSLRQRGNTFWLTCQQARQQMKKLLGDAAKQVKYLQSKQPRNKGKTHIMTITSPTDFKHVGGVEFLAGKSPMQGDGFSFPPGLLSPNGKDGRHSPSGLLSPQGKDSLHSPSGLLSPNGKGGRHSPSGLFSPNGKGGSHFLLSLLPGKGRRKPIKSPDNPYPLEYQAKGTNQPQNDGDSQVRQVKSAPNYHDPRRQGSAGDNHDGHFRSRKKSGIDEGDFFKLDERENFSESDLIQPNDRKDRKSKKKSIRVPKVSLV